MMRSILLCCVACGATRTPKSSSLANAADAVVGKRSYFIYGVRGSDPEVVPWSGAGTVLLDAGHAFVLERGDGRGRIQAVAGRPARTLGAAIEGEHPGSGLGMTAMPGVTPTVVVIADLVVVQGRSEMPPASSSAGVPPLQQNYLEVLRSNAHGLGNRLQQLPWPAIRTVLLPSTDVDGDGRLDLVTYECAEKCTVGFWRATATQLDAEKPIATWSNAERFVIGKSTPVGYVIVAAEPFAIRTYALERGALRELAQVAHGPREDTTALMGPVAVGDFDHDQKLDIAGVSRGNALFAWSNGKPVSVTNALSDRIQQIAFVDLDRDGDDDLLVATDTDVAMYRGSPSGLESSPSWRAHLP